MQLLLEDVQHPAILPRPLQTLRKHPYWKSQQLQPGATASCGRGGGNRRIKSSFWSMHARTWPHMSLFPTCPLSPERPYRECSQPQYPCPRRPTNGIDGVIAGWPYIPLQCSHLFSFPHDGQLDGPAHLCGRSLQCSSAHCTAECLFSGAGN